MSQPGGRLGPTDRRILKLAFPALGSLAVEPVYLLVDTAIVGRLGTDQLAGLAIAATILSFAFAGANFLTYGTTERVARRIGSGDQPGASNVGVQAMWLSLMFGLPAAALLGVFARQLASLFGATGSVLEHATTYLSISAIAVPFVLVTLAAQGVLRGASQYILPLWILLVSNIANLLIELVLVFGLDMGVAGSAWSTVISQAGAALAFVWFIRKRLMVASQRRPSRAGIAPLMTAGKHLLLRVGSMLIVTGGATAVAARVDGPTLASHQIVSSMLIFLALSLDALAIPAQTIIAEELGRDGKSAAAFVARRSAVLSIWAGAVLGVIIAASAPWLPLIFTGDDDVASRATGGVWWLAAMMIPAAIAFAYDGVLIGAADYRFLGRAALGYAIVVAPVGAAVLLYPTLGLAGIWGGLTLWMVIRAIVNHRRVMRVLGPPAEHAAGSSKLAQA